MPKLTPEDRERLKSAHPTAAILRTPAAREHDFVFRDATLVEFDALLMAINGSDNTEKARAHRTFARDTLLFPAPAEWDAFAASRPGIAHSLGHELSQRAGLGAEVLVDLL